MAEWGCSFLAVVLAWGSDAVTPGMLRTHATLHSIGIEWDLSGDADHDARCAVRYRLDGQAAWRNAPPLFRVDFHGWYADRKADRAYNMVAGSILFLQPGRSYEVELDLSDPDGGSTRKRFEIRTRSVPALSEEGRTLRVVPGEGGGDGSSENPFRGLKPAQDAARPGDLLLLRAGRYGGFTFSKSGEPGRYVAWKAAGEGEVAFDQIEVAASHLWLEGLTFTSNEGGNGLRGRGACADVVVRRNSFSGFHYSILLSRQSRDWHISDNVIAGDNNPDKGGISGEGVELLHTSGHVVAHNRISRTADGISYPGRNCDMYGNDIFDVSDDGLEPDYGYANNRMWGNRITNAYNNALSFQGMFCGPWYFIRNQTVGRGGIFKFRVQDRYLVVHNTFVRWGNVGTRMHHYLTALSRNNLFISAGGKPGPVWSAYAVRNKKSARYLIPDRFTPDWRTDLDYDGFDWGESRHAFRWGPGLRYFPNLSSFSEAVGVERNGIRVRKEEIFENWNLPGEPGRVEPRTLTLRKGNAVDAGARLPGINDAYGGKAPDLGAHERGTPLPWFGPRPDRGTPVFTSGRDGYHSFRIPSLIVSKQGTLLAFCEGRKNSRSDTGDIDLVLRRSTDGGATWRPLQVVWDDGPNTCGNPCPVVERGSGAIVLLLTHNLGKDPQRKIVAGTSEGSRTVWITRSEDDGATWSKPVEITKDVKKPEWTWYATGPGVGIQTKSGRLVVPCDHSTAGQDREWSHVITSDDAGKTWKLGGRVDGSFGESQVAERADGSLLINMRNHRSPHRERGVAVSTDEGATWSKPRYDETLIEPVCQGSIMRYTARPEDNWLLFSNPASRKGRRNLTLRLSRDGGKTWPSSKVITPGPAAYSCLAVLADGQIGCLYEGGDKSAYEHLLFARVPLGTLLRE